MKAIWRALTSPKTCIWVCLALCAAGAAGSLLLGRLPDLFGDMDAQVLLSWLLRKGFAHPGKSAWFHALLLCVGFLGLHSACCTADRLVQIFRGKATLRRLLPHAMHLAFLGVLLSHLASSVSGDRIPGIAVPQGRFAPVGGTGLVLRLDRLDVTMAPQGYPKDFSAAVTLFRGFAPVAGGTIRSNEPLFHEGYGFYLKNFGPTPWGVPYAVFDANRDPGAFPVLVASVLFTAANLLYLLPARRENG